MLEKRRPFLLIFVTVLLIIIIIFAFYLYSLRQTSPIVKEESWPVSIQVIKEKAYAPIITLYGKIESYQSTSLKSAIEADVQQVLIKEGQTVQPNQTLLLLDKREAKIAEKQRLAEYQQIQAQIKELNIKHEADKLALKRQQERVKLQRQETQRLETLYKKQVSSASLWDQAKSLLAEQQLKYIEIQLAIENFPAILDQKQAELLRAEANLDKARLDLNRTIIKAPYAAKITAVPIAIGNRVQPGEILVELFPLNGIEVRAQIPNSDLPSIKQALMEGKILSATTHVDNEALIFQLDRLAANVGSGQAGVDGIFSLQNPNVFLAKNRIIGLKLKLPLQKGLIAVPISALFNGNTIYLVVQQRLKAQKIKIIGTWYNKKNRPYRLIKSPKKIDGSLLLTTHLLNARDGLKVNVQLTGQPMHE